MALWTNWMHRGFLTAVSNCQMCVLDATKFQQISGLFEHPPLFDPSTYAAHFVNVLDLDGGELTDLFIVPFPLGKIPRRGSGKAVDEAMNNTEWIRRRISQFFVRTMNGPKTDLAPTASTAQANRKS